MAIGQNIESVDNPVWVQRTNILADGVGEFKPVGFEMDWADVAAVAGADVTLVDGQVIKIGEKHVRYGSVIYKHTTGLYRVATDVAPAAYVPGETFVLQSTITDQDGTSPFFGGALMGGIVFEALLAVGGAGQPTMATVRTNIPRLTLFGSGY